MMDRQPRFARWQHGTWRGRRRFEFYYNAGVWHKCGGASCWCSRLACSRQRVCHMKFVYNPEWHWAPSQQWDKPNPHSPVQHAMRASQVAVSLDVDFTSTYACR